MEDVLYEEDVPEGDGPISKTSDVGPCVHIIVVCFVLQSLLGKFLCRD